MSEEKDWIVQEGPDDQCQLFVDPSNRCLILEFSTPIETFAFDIEIAEGLAEALERGIKMLRQLDS